MKVTRGTLNVVAAGGAATLAELAGVPDAAKGFGIPPEARITHISVTHTYPNDAEWDSRKAELTIGWEMPT